MYALLLATALALAADEPYALADAGVTLHLPRGWHMARWSDWDFKGKSDDGAVQLQVWATPFQVPVDEDAARAWADNLAKQMVDEGFTDIRVEASAATTVAGRPTATYRLSLGSESFRGRRAVLHGASFTGAAQVLHLYTLSLASLSDRAERARQEILERLVLDRGPVAVQEGEIQTPAGFAATLPAGWRAPLPEEMGAVLLRTEAVGRDELPAESCWVALRPPPVGEPDVMFACAADLYLGRVDEHSFAGEEPAVRERFFGKVNPPVPPAEAVPAGDRTAFYFRLPKEEEPVRLAVAPYGAGKVMLLWALSRHLDGAALDAAVLPVLASVRYTGPDGGAPQIGADKQVYYWLRYRTLSPVVLVPALVLAAVAWAILRATRKKQPPAY